MVYFVDRHKLITDYEFSNITGNDNLLEQSDSWGKKWLNKSNDILQEKFYSGKILRMKYHGLNNAIVFDLGVPSDTQITWSVFAKSDDGVLHTELDGGGGKSMVKIAKDWTRYSFTGRTGTTNSNLYFWNNDGAPIYLALPKAEYGTITTRWVPSLKEFAMKSDVDALGLEIQALKNKIGGVTSRLYTSIAKALATSAEMEVA